MGCLNSDGSFSHYFGNIHFSGPCNRSCYFCIGQHMLGLDSNNNLNEWPLKNIDEFIDKCKEKQVTEINFTGTNTDPLLYQHLDTVCEYLRGEIPNVILGIRTNGVLVKNNCSVWRHFDKGSISITSFDKEIYKHTMGQGSPPNLEKILELDCKISNNLKINIVLCPEILKNNDLIKTISYLNTLGIKKINIREPYGQAHIGDPLANLGFEKAGTRLGMPYYNIGGSDVTYWDVHYVEVESVNLYANGVVSTTYPVTKGYDPDLGEVKDQNNFPKSGRYNEQWVAYRSDRLYTISNGKR